MKNMICIALVATTAVYASDASKAAGAGHLSQEERELLQQKMKERGDRMRAALRMVRGEMLRDSTDGDFTQRALQAVEKVTSGHASVTQNKKGE